jgi:hypothetical protein
VKVSPDAFEIVGRPQVEPIAIAHGSPPTTETKQVLYAPTWFGYLNATSARRLAAAIRGRLPAVLERALRRLAVVALNRRWS